MKQGFARRESSLVVSCILSHAGRYETFSLPARVAPVQTNPLGGNLGDAIATRRWAGDFRKRLGLAGKTKVLKRHLNDT